MSIDRQNSPANEETSVSHLVGRILHQWPVIVGSSALMGALAFGSAFLMPPTYTAKTVILPPQQQQSSLSSALGSLGALAGFAGGMAGIKSPAEQYIALLSSETVSDRIIAQYELAQVYDEKYRSDVRKKLLKSVAFTAGKKDSLITIEVDDRDPDRAAKMANSYVEQLRLMSNGLALSEAQQRRKFFEEKLQETKEALTRAQVSLQGSGFNPGAIKAEPKAAAEAYSRLRAEAVAAETRLKALSSTFVESSPEVRSQAAVLSSIQAELAKLESSQTQGNDSDYVGKYREFKYQETLFDLFAKQYELARVDEGREGGLIQIVDPAQVPDKPAKPKKMALAILGLLMGALFSSIHVVRKSAR